LARKPGASLYSFNSKCSLLICVHLQYQQYFRATSLFIKVRGGEEIEGGGNGLDKHEKGIEKTGEWERK
jgi:hypothetical protein